MTQHTRRLFLSSTALAVGAVAAPRAASVFAQEAQHTPSPAPKIPTSDTRLKLNPDGTRRPFRGNTVICHLQPQGATRDAVERIATDLQSSSLMPKIAPTPPASYHMTVYPGANDQDRDITGWPSDLPKDASIDERNRTIGERMQQFHLGSDLPIRMKVDFAKTIANLRPATLRMIGAGAAEEKKIRAIEIVASMYLVSAMPNTMSTVPHHSCLPATVPHPWRAEIISRHS